MSRIGFGAQSAIAKIPVVVGDIAGRTIRELNGHRHDTTYGIGGESRCGWRNRRILDRNLARDERRSSRAGDTENDVIRAYICIGMDRISVRTDGAIAKIPAIGVDATCGLAGELDGQRRISVVFIGDKSRNWSG